VGATSRELGARRAMPFDRYSRGIRRARSRPDRRTRRWFCGVLTPRGSDRILGATIVGRDAGEQLSPLVMALTRRLGLKAPRLAGAARTRRRSEYLRRILDAYSLTRTDAVSPRVHSGGWLRRTL